MTDRERKSEEECFLFMEKVAVKIKAKKGDKQPTAASNSDIRRNSGISTAIRGRMNTPILAESKGFSP